MKHKLYFIPILLLVLFTLVACGSEEAPEEAAGTTPTEASSASNTDTDSSSDSDADSSSDDHSTDATTSEEGSTDTSASTDSAEVKAQALTNLNLRGGPGTNYPVAGKLAKDDEIMLIGRTEDSTWFQAENAAGDKVWLSGDAELVSVDAAMVASLPVSEADAPPPPAYNSANAEVNKVLNEIPLVVHHGDNYTCASHGGLTHPLADVVDGHVIGPHAGDFVYQNNNVLFKRSGGSYVLIRENPIARFDGDLETLPFAKAMQLFESGEITWTGDFGQAGRGVPGCDPRVP